MPSTPSLASLATFALVAGLGLTAGCDAPSGRGTGARPVDCAGGKCDSTDPTGASTDAPDDDGEAAGLLEELQHCYVSNNALEVGRPDCLSSILEDIDALLEDHDAWTDPQEFQAELCDLVFQTTELHTRQKRASACRTRAEVVLAETSLSVVSLGAPPLNTIPSDRARRMFEDCIREGYDRDAGPLLSCARDEIEAKLGDVRNNLFLEAVEGYDMSEAEAQDFVDDRIRDLTVAERDRNAQLCETLAEDHEERVLTENLCQLEYEAQVAFELSLTSRWTPSGGG